jgi:hypothetical protein
MKQLLIDTQLFIPKANSLNEVKTFSNGNLMVEGILATAEEKNGNGRYYSRELWEREVEKYIDAINEKRSGGELDHPESQVVNLKNVSHAVREISWDGNNVLGIIEIFPTASGNILKTLIENDYNVGVSSRGMGSLKQVGEAMEVQDDFDLLCWDFVSMPSNKGSWMKKRLNESQLHDTITSFEKYKNVNYIITEILCSQGTCPIF